MSAKKDHVEQKAGKEFKLGRTSKVLMVLAALLLVFSFIAPWLLTRYSLMDMAPYGTIGDTLGGIMNPFIAAAGVISTFLAFYMQVRANKLQRELFEEQIIEERNRFKLDLGEQQKQFKQTAFEQRFYEMLRLHKENIDEMSYVVRPVNKESKEVYGRKVFVEFLKEVETIYAIVKHYFPMEDKAFHIDLAYSYFFQGIGVQDLRYAQKSSKDPYDKARKGIMQINLIHKNRGGAAPGLNGIAHHTGNRIKKLPHCWLGYGHSSQLGHYYRHLYQTVKFVAKEPEEFISYEEKRSYLRTLRAQLSNEEQAMLFYNYKSKYGSKWDSPENKFITDYRMIHNLNNGLLIYDFDLKEEFDLKNNPQYRKEIGRDDDHLFEFQEYWG
ncbi:putative phage abortive infection protein [Muricauda oceani]|uniref:Phage abortive infection protein n=1 Tax=Flagellimonas oceani TaxID=2698672 RepID=A0A6G7J6G9_9FLAO|nr:putative phage abortive infection protein [Allomuricauda oceani]MBW8242530.1 putative phage abortive infection protein [Allomuricauda oceani]QII46290.1 hypothetical protein GVT53_16910 [Allomuricauda oceani]